MGGRQAGLTQRPPSWTLHAPTLTGRQKRLALCSASSPRWTPTVPDPETYKACSPSRRLGMGSGGTESGFSG